MSQCAPCTAAWGDIELGCANSGRLYPHDERMASLAEALAAEFNPWDDDDSKLEHIGWFMEDAEDIIASGKVTGPPWKIRTITTTDNIKFSVNGKMAVFHDGEKSRGFVEVFGDGSG